MTFFPHKNIISGKKNIFNIQMAKIKKPYFIGLVLAGQTEWWSPVGAK
jgi:hypothetical protein